MSGRGLDLLGRVCVVTGAGQGLGRAEAAALAARGGRIVAVDVRATAETVEAIRGAGGEATGLRLDLADRESAGRVLEVALASYGGLDVLVNNAGVLRDRMSFNLSREDWETSIAVNLSASFHLAQAAIRWWRERHRDGDRTPRAIVSTSSESGLYGNAGQANYAAAKAGVAALTLTLAAELARYGIRVNAIAPRARTPMSEQQGWSLPRTEAGDPFAPEHVAEVVAWLVSDAAHDVTGQLLTVHGAGIDVMQTWSVRRRLRHGGDWTDAELLELRDQLFPDGRAGRLAAPIHHLFTHSNLREEDLHDHVDSGS